MRRLYWNSFSFTSGVHRYPSHSELGDNLSAGDMRNLRVDGDGYLRLRNAVPAVISGGAEHAYTGVGVSDKHLWTLRNGVSPTPRSGELQVFELSAGERDGVSSTPRDVRNALLRRQRRIRVPDNLKLDGRLWVLDEFKDFVIGTSEGSDFGFWVDVRGENPIPFSGDELNVHTLGLLPPAMPYFFPGGSKRDSLTTGLYVYALTSVRAFFKNPDDVPLPPQVLEKDFSGRDVLFNGMESEPTYFVLQVGVEKDFRVQPGTGIDINLDVDFYADGKRIEQIVQLPAENQGLRLANVVFPDVQQTGIYVYRTEHISVYDSPSRMDVEDLPLRVVDFLWKANPRRGGAPDTASTLFSVLERGDFGEAVWGARAFMRRDNQRLPSQAFMLAHFNGRLFAPVGDALRYSDVRDGVPVQWAWPAANSIRVSGVVLFCVEHRGVLLFGGPGGIWRLTGADEYSFDVDRVSGIGPVSRGAFGRFASSIGFIAAGGFYVTDGVDVQQVSSPALDGYFERTALGAVEDTVIRFSIPGVTAVHHVNVRFVARIESRGRFVTEIPLVSPPRGKIVALSWDGRDANGELQAPGTYELVLYAMVAGDVLDRYESVLFELVAADNEIVDGAVTLLPNDDWLFCVKRADGVALQFLRSAKGGGWFVWRVGDIRQFVSGRIGGTQRVLCVDGAVVREVLWDDFTVDSDGEGAIPWRWQSQEIDFGRENVALRGEMKLFMWVEVFGTQEGSQAGTLRIWVDGVKIPEVPFVFRGKRSARVPIGRRGEQIRFEVFGEGDLVLRHLRLVAGVRDDIHIER